MLDFIGGLFGLDGGEFYKGLSKGVAAVPQAAANAYGAAAQGTKAAAAVPQAVATGATAALAPKPNSMQTHGLYQGPAGTYTGNARGELERLGLLPQAPTYEPPRIDYQARSNQIADLRRLASGPNPYAIGGDLFNQALGNVVGDLGARQQQTLGTLAQNLARQGITNTSGLNAQLQGQARLDAAKEASRQGSQLRQAFGTQAAAYDERNRDFLARLAQLESNIGSQDFNNQLAALREQRAQDEMLYGRRLDQALDPLRVGSAQQGLLASTLANQDAATRLRYLAPSLQQGLTMGQQRIDLGQLGIELQRAVQAGQISAENARNALAAAANNADLSVLQNPMYQGMYTTNALLRAQNDGRREVMTPYTETVGPLQQGLLGFLGRFASPAS